MIRTRRQLSLFGVEAADPSPLDLAGLLFGPARLTRMGGTARLVVPVDAAWRVHALAVELRARGIEISWRPARPDPPPGPAEPEPATPAPAQARETGARPDGDLDDAEVEFTEPDGAVVGAAARPAKAEEASAAEAPPVEAATVESPVAEVEAPGFEVLTAYSMLLAPLRRPAFLSGPRLRLWMVAAGTAAPGVVHLRGGDDLDAAAAVLARAGLKPQPIAGTGVFRVSGRRPLARLAELVGDRPPAAPEEAWPTSSE